MASRNRFWFIDIMRRLKLPKSTRKYIREQKRKIRIEYGKNSKEEETFFEWIGKERINKEERAKNAR